MLILITLTNSLLHMGLHGLVEYELFVTANKKMILDEATRLLQSALAPYYSLFKKTLLTSMGLVLAGFALLGLNTVLPVIADVVTPQYLFLSSVLAISAGVALIALSIVRKRRVHVFDVQIYPIVAIPYGDGSSAVLVDFLGGIGDDVSLRIPRTDRLAQDLKSLLEKLASTLEVFNKTSIEPHRLGQVLTAKISGEGTTWLFEEKVQEHIVEIRELLANTPVSYLSLKLLESPGEVKLFKEPLATGFLGCDEVGEPVDKATSTVLDGLEPLKKEYEELLNTVKSRVHSTVEFMDVFYRDVEELAERVVNALRRSLEKQYVLLCPRCLSSKPGVSMYTPNLPVLLSTPAQDEEVSYRCSTCGSIFEYTHSVHHEEALHDVAKPIKMHKAEHLQSIAWSLFYTYNRDLIRNAIKEARFKKELKYEEAYRFVEDYMKSLKEFLLPLYTQMVWYVKNVEASSAMLEQIAPTEGGGGKLCEKPVVSTYALDVIQKMRDLIGPGETVRKHLYELGEARKIWTNKVFNEVVIGKLSEAYRTLGKHDYAKRVLELYQKMDYDELVKILGVKPDEQE